MPEPSEARAGRLPRSASACSALTPRRVRAAVSSASRRRSSAASRCCCSCCCCGGGLPPSCARVTSASRGRRAAWGAGERFERKNRGLIPSRQAAAAAGGSGGGGVGAAPSLLLLRLAASLLLQPGRAAVAHETRDIVGSTLPPTPVEWAGLPTVTATDAASRVQVDERRMGCNGDRSGKLQPGHHRLSCHIQLRALSRCSRIPAQ